MMALSPKTVETYRHRAMQKLGLTNRAELVRYANSLLKNRVLFGSDFPVLTPDRWIRDAGQTALKPEVMPGIMKDNAARLLGLAPSDHPLKEQT